MDTPEKFESWAKVELFGHQVIVGKVSEATVGGCSFLRVDVPAVGDGQAYTKFYGNGAVYAMTPCSEEVAMLLLKRYRTDAISRYELPAPSKAIVHEELSMAAAEDDINGHDDDDQGMDDYTGMD